MSGVGPVEPGEGTHAWDGPAPPAPKTSGRRGRPARACGQRRRAALAAAAVAVVLGGGAYLYATRPQHQTPLPPFPSQVVDISYLGTRPGPLDATRRGFAFDVALSVRSGPPVTVTRIDQPYAGLEVTSEPPVPVRATTGSPRRVTVTVYVTDCRKVPGNAGLPFLDVTLRNPRAIEVHSFILGTRYAQRLSAALQVACSNDSQ